MISLVLLFALQITPELTQHINAGLKAKAAGDLDTAIREFQRVVQLAPTLPAAHVNLGAAYVTRKDYGSAVPPLRKALELDNNLPGAHALLGTALLAQGFASDAIPHLERGEQTDLLGVALLEAGRPREAVDRLEAVLATRPQDPDLLYYLSHAHDRLARLLFDRLRRAEPDSARTHQMTAEALAAGGERESAERHFRAALLKRPDLRGVHYAIGDLLLQTGNYETAEAEFRAEARLTPGSAAAFYKLGLVLVNRGQTEEALLHLRRANDLSPKMPETLLELGKALNASGDARSAEEFLLQVLTIENEGDIAEAAHFQLAAAYRQLGRPADAERELKLFQQLRSRRSKR